MFFKPHGACLLIVDMNAILYGYTLQKIMYEVGKWLPVIISRKIPECKNYSAVTIFLRNNWMVILPVKRVFVYFCGEKVLPLRMELLWLKFHLSSDSALQIFQCTIDL